MDRYESVQVEGKIIGRVCIYKDGGKERYTPLNPDYRPLAPAQATKEAAVEIIKSYHEDEDETVSPV